MANDGPDSVFTRELAGKEYQRWVEVVDLRTESRLPRCPGCRDGHLVSRTGPHGAFFGCTNFPHCLHKQKLGGR
jgi:ssDNA-binding Zn-finger/Zn-ribbon topoisomerase 1